MKIDPNWWRQAVVYEIYPRSFMDLDGDGLQDAGEPGINGAVVTLVITYANGSVVTLKTVAGDNPATVGAIAARAGVPGAQAPVDARTLPTGDGRLALLGHSMASDIIIRYAQAHPEVAATVTAPKSRPPSPARAARAPWRPIAYCL